MAKILFSAVVGDARKKIGGVVFTKGSTGAVVRRKVSPTQPRTQDQRNVRASFSSLSKNWATAAATGLECRRSENRRHARNHTLRTHTHAARRMGRTRKRVHPKGPVREHQNPDWAPDIPVVQPQPRVNRRRIHQRCPAQPGRRQPRHPNSHSDRRGHPRPHRRHRHRPSDRRGSSSLRRRPGQPRPCVHRKTVPFDFHRDARHRGPLRYLDRLHV